MAGVWLVRGTGDTGRERDRQLRLSLLRLTPSQHATRDWPDCAPLPGPSLPQVRAAEERADGLSLELQYAQSEAARLAAEVELAREAAERRARCVQMGAGWLTRCGMAGIAGGSTGCEGL